MTLGVVKEGRQLEMRALIYTRTSTKEQALGHASQEDQCRQHAERQGWEVVGVWQDQVSGKVKVTKRPGFTALLSEVKQDDVLLISKRDRLGRDLIGNTLAEGLVENRGGRIVALDCASGPDPSSVFMRHVIDAVSEYERSLIAERIRAALAEKRRRGESLGMPNLGFKSDEEGRLVEDHEEQATLKQVRDWRREGRSYQEIYDACVEAGITSRRGTTPSLSTIAAWSKGITLPKEPPQESAGPHVQRRTPSLSRRVEGRQPGLQATILDLHARRFSQREIAEELTKRGYLTRNGTPLSQTQIWRVLARAKEEALKEAREG
jgi:DNA invertase Pin-like site-specific DNA recombinase